MATSAETIEYLMDQLRDLPETRTRKMFGEYCLYLDDKPIAFVCDDELFVKPTTSGRDFIGEPEDAQAYPGSSLYFRVTQDQWEDRDFLVELLYLTGDELPASKPKLQRRKS